MNIKHTLVALAIGLTSTLSFAVDKIEVSDEFDGKIQTLIGPRAQTIEYFKTDHGLIGVAMVAKQTFKKHVFYTNTDADFLMSGMLFDIDSNTQINPIITNQVKVTLPKTMTDELTALSTVTDGTGEDVVYAFVDVNCPYCHRIHESLVNVDRTKVRIEWVLVGFLGQRSISTANAILNEADNSLALAHLEQAMSKQNVPENNGVLGKLAREQSESFLRTMQVSGVPFVMSNIQGDWSMDRGLPNAQFFAALPQNQASNESALVASE
jgi:thiol:disulfide interchange protein DsbG